ncbi:hypothetical protein DPMN_121745 [Dreissena polymorpha]|uniref:Uncharacterized protein n=1 Tax=Dreissena polymorpha TaxID=45954 RepID=A0A9D4GR57_DREPO|nr:hypothetical protein DPMN_121745 [Dreissena polymorpha]
MVLEEDFDHPVTEFIVYETNDRKQHMIRICHYEIAKEILEQILSRDCSRHAWEHHYSEKLSKNACKNLAAFSKDFIEYCSNKKTSNYKSSPAIGHILTKTFIYRDEIDLTLTAEDLPRKKSRVSQLLLDIPAGKPMFEERLQILEKLASSFPDDPNFHAHVGRFYAFCGPDDDEKAEQKFKKAISLVEKRMARSNLDQLDDSSKSTLVHVYHMYGSFKKKQISSMIGKHKNEETKTMEAEEKFYVKISKLVEAAELACELFDKSRVMTPETCEIFTGSYIGEIDVRLQISDYVIRHYKETASEHEVLKTFMESEATAECKTFIEETLCRLEYLFNACSEEADIENMEKHSIMTMIKWYNALFKLQVLPQECLTDVHDIDKRRIKISAQKLDYGSRPELNGIENVNDAGAVEKIITLYEDNFKDISMGLLEVVSKKDLNYDYQECMCAIRHELCQRVYSLNDVCTRVQIWNQTVRSPMSLFYLFVVKSVMGIGHDGVQGNTESLIEAKELQQELTKKVSWLLKPKHHREWLGNGIGIKAILQSNQKIPISHHEVKDQRVLSVNLKVCKGTICPPNNKPCYGQIELDLQVDNLKVFFVPKRAELDGPRHKGRRVQFNLAFSFEHGYEALNVKVLKRHVCSNCSQKLEFKISDTSLVCPTCKVTVYKDDLNEVKSDSDEEKKN